MKAIAVLFSILASVAAHAGIFGDDDRQEVRNYPVMEKLARSTAVQVPLNFITDNQDGTVNLEFLPAMETWGICRTERFSEQPTSSIPCTGFLVGPDLLMTAGHCAVNWTKLQQTVTPQCEGFAWVFDHQLESDGTVKTKRVPKSRVARCKEVIYANQDVSFNKDTGIYTFKEDIALLRLERAIDREPLKLATAAVARADRLTAVGYPLGLPAKGIMSGRVKESNSTDYFRTDLDVFGGNSGGPVFNDRKQVVGLMVRNFPDPELIPDPARSCLRANRCSSDLMSCDANDRLYPIGSEIQRIEAIFPFLAQ